MRKFDNYSSALETLKQAKNQDLENEFVQSGIIAKFSLQFDRSWKLMKELLKYEGDKTAAIGSPREIIKAVYAYYDWMDEDVWLQMLRDRNDTAHIYDAALAERLVATIIDRYIPEFERMGSNVAARYADIL